MANWPNPFIEQRADPLFYATAAITTLLPPYRNMTGWKSAGLIRWKGCAPPTPLSSGVNRKAAL